jgi:hypothetical protein
MMPSWYQNLILLTVSLTSQLAQDMIETLKVTRHMLNTELGLFTLQGKSTKLGINMAT